VHITIEIPCLRACRSIAVRHTEIFFSACRPNVFNRIHEFPLKPFSCLIGPWPCGFCLVLLPLENLHMNSLWKSLASLSKYSIVVQRGHLRLLTKNRQQTSRIASEDVRFDRTLALRLLSRPSAFREFAPRIHSENTLLHCRGTTMSYGGELRHQHNTVNQHCFGELRLLERILASRLLSGPSAVSLTLHHDQPRRYHNNQNSLISDCLLPP
jgi:hypothetical protein